MRPIKLKIKGLNSFVEEQTIDFEKLTKQGFFGIFGPTGSGKSTILDGMILALYGMKAMSRGTNEFVNKNCKSAQISYEFQISGTEIKRYRVEREFKAHEKGTKSGKCKLLDITDGEIVLEESVSRVDQACAEIIGLSSDDFMRTVVLPQGKFSEFLKVGGKDRREILERLFRLEEYGARLEERVSGALRLENESRTKLVGQTEAYVECSKELLEEKEESLKELEKKLLREEALLLTMQKEAAETENVWELQKEEARRTQDFRELQEKRDEVETWKERIARGERAGHVVPILHSVKELEKKAQALQEMLPKAEAAYCRWKDELLRRQKLFEEAEKRREEKEGPLIAAVNQAEEAVEFCKELPELIKTQQEKERQAKELIKTEQALKEQESVICEKTESQQKRLEQLEKDCRTKMVSSDDRRQLEILTAFHNELKMMTEELKKKSEEWDRIQKRMVKYTDAVQDIQKEERELEKKLSLSEEELKKFCDSAEQIQILQLQEKLREGQPCPVCGSIHFKIRREPCGEHQENELVLLEKIESIKEKISGIQEERQRKRSEKQVQTELCALAEEEAAVQRKKKTELEEAVCEKQNAFEAKAEQWHITSLDEEKERLHRMDVEREEAEQTIRTEKAKREEYESSLKILQEQRIMQKETRMQLEFESALLGERIIQKQEQIVSRIGEQREPKAYLKMLRSELSELQQAYKSSKIQKEEAECELKESEERRSELNGEKKGNREALIQGKAHLQAEMERQKFISREEAEQSVLEEPFRKTYLDRIERYEKELRETEICLAEIQRKRDGRSVTEEQYQNSKEGLDKLEKAVKLQREELTEIRQEIKRIRKSLEKQAELAAQIQVIEHKIAVLEELRSVTRGKRFVEFMATERLKYISKSASERLYQITNGNYELEINHEGEFVIRDNKNGGVRRQTATLSGGETFVTSLALALALSAEIQLKGTAPLELFFLDEGFGSLDETLLDIVMESLEKIYHEQLKVGIISHVESVKMRVPVRLIVSPAEMGVSGSKVHIEFQ